MVEENVDICSNSNNRNYLFGKCRNELEINEIFNEKINKLNKFRGEKQVSTDSNSRIKIDEIIWDSPYDICPLGIEIQFMKKENEPNIIGKGIKQLLFDYAHESFKNKKLNTLCLAIFFSFTPHKQRIHDWEGSINPLGIGFLNLNEEVWKIRFAGFSTKKPYIIFKEHTVFLSNSYNEKYDKNKILKKSLVWKEYDRM